jgi:UDP-N-acetylmuramoyl-tripeptide--D-alanyl-D-alanine ligase
VIALTLAEVADVVGGRLADTDDPDATVTATPSVDSRAIEPGALFVAVAGERVDGHDYAAEAVRAGAVGVLASRPIGVPAVVVADVVTALGRLARTVLDRLPAAVVIGVTGSSGKTGTKDLLAAVLAPLGPTVAAAGSFNNEIGLPLTVLRANSETRHLVLEYSARNRGHIAYLCTIAPPHIGIELNVGRAHLGVFGSVDAIAAAKMELVAALPTDGLAVLNADDARVRAMRERSRAPVVTAGLATDADVRAEGVTLGRDGRPLFTLCAPAGRARVRLAGVGAHQVTGALAAAAVALRLGMPVEAVAAGLAAARPASRWRMEVVERADGVTVINDAYNANPDSAAAALRALTAIAHPDARRSWAVLGEMLELGERSAAEHAEVGHLAAELGVSRLVAVGAGAAAVADGAAATAGWGGTATRSPDVEAATSAVAGQLRAGDVVLVKASRGIGLESLAAALLAAAPTVAASQSEPG